MAFIPQEGKGRLFDQTIDKSNQKQPDWSGSASCPCCGNHLRLSGWRNPPSETQRVATIGLQLQSYADYEKDKAERQARRAASQPSSKPEPPQGDFDDDIPF